MQLLFIPEPAGRSRGLSPGFADPLHASRIAPAHSRSPLQNRKGEALYSMPPYHRTGLHSALHTALALQLPLTRPYAILLVTSPCSRSSGSGVSHAKPCYYGMCTVSHLAASSATPTTWTCLPSAAVNPSPSALLHRRWLFKLAIDSRGQSTSRSEVGIVPPPCPHRSIHISTIRLSRLCTCSVQAVARLARLHRCSHIATTCDLPSTRCRRACHTAAARYCVPFTFSSHAPGGGSATCSQHLSRRRDREHASIYRRIGFAEECS